MGINEAPKGADSGMEKPIYALAILESTIDHKPSRTYVPVLDHMSAEFYKEHQNGWRSEAGTLEEIMEIGKQMSEKDNEENPDMSAGVTTPEDWASWHPVDRDFVLPSKEDNL